MATLFEYIHKLSPLLLHVRLLIDVSQSAISQSCFSRKKSNRPYECHWLSSVNDYISCSSSVRWRVACLIFRDELSQIPRYNRGPFTKTIQLRGLETMIVVLLWVNLDCHWVFFPSFVPFPWSRCVLLLRLPRVSDMEIRCNCFQ